MCVVTEEEPELQRAPFAGTLFSEIHIFHWKALELKTVMDVFRIIQDGNRL